MLRHQMAFRWRADDGPLIALSLPSSTLSWIWIKNVVGTLQFASIRFL